MRGFNNRAGLKLATLWYNLVHEKWSQQLDILPPAASHSHFEFTLHTLSPAPMQPAAYILVSILHSGAGLLLVAMDNL